MKRMLTAVMVVVLLVGCGCVPSSNRFLSVTLRPQEQSNWCWAASGQMVMEFLGHGVNQCTQANNRFGRADCCNNPTPAACNNGGWPEFSEYDFTSQVTSNAALTWEQVQGQIDCEDKPFAFTWHWDGGGGHMMVLTGYWDLDFWGADVQLVWINDPWAPNVGDQRVLSYSQYVSGSGYTHWDDYYDVTYVGD